MSGLPIQSKYANSPQRLITDADRDELVARLNQAYTAGDLDVERYQELLDGLYAATTQGQLVPLAEALPVRYQTTDPQGATGESALAPGEVNDPAIRNQAGNQFAMHRWVMLAGVIVGMVLVVVMIFGIVFGL